MSTDERLQNAFEFGPDDLAANQRGEITDWQRRRLREKQTQALQAFAVPGAAGVFLVAYGGRATALFAVAMIALVAYLTYTAFVRWRALQRESQMTNGVESIHGWVTKKVGRSRNSTTYRLVVNGSEFKLSLAQFDSLIEGIEYRVYYVPLSQTILSLEAEESRGNQPGYFAERLGKL